MRLTVEAMYILTQFKRYIKRTEEINIHKYIVFVDLEKLMIGYIDNLRSGLGFV